MVRTIERHSSVLAYAVACAWMTCCSTYDSALLSQAEGGQSTPIGDGDGDGDTGSGGLFGDGDGDGDSEGSGGRGSSGGGENVATGGMSAAGGMENLGGESSSGGDGSGGSCSMGDCCPDDPDKDEPLVCGCGVPEQDTDGDDAPDCVDQCPAEPTKTEPGECGCDVSLADDAKCAVLKAGIAHRYSFGGSGVQAADSLGTAHGTIMNGAVQSGGVATFDGVNQYVSLPAGMISPLTNATFEFWFTWNGGDNYQRLMDFGDTTGTPAVGQSYLYLAVSKLDEGPGSGFSLMGNASEVETEATDVITTGVKYHIALVADDEGGAFSLYIDGAFQSGIAFTSSLSGINDVNCYLGRSLFEADSYFSGEIDEFRVYDVALSSSQIAYSYLEGPDATFFE
jgi:hypothetical protein